MSDTKAQIQETLRTLSRLSTKRPLPKHIIVKLKKTKDKEKLLKETWGAGWEYLIHKRIKIRITSDFSSEIM
jgi:hypothetical protein